MNDPIYTKSTPLSDALYKAHRLPVSLAVAINTEAWNEFQASNPAAHERLKDDDAAESILELNCQKPGSIDPGDYTLVLKIYDPGG